MDFYSNLKKSDKISNLTIIVQPSADVAKQKTAPQTLVIS